MSHHGYRHSRISRIINSKHRHEDGEEDLVDDLNPISYDLDEAQAPLAPEDAILTEPCAQLLNKACSEDATGLSEDLLVKRQAESSATAAAVETSVQVVESISQTVWPSTGVDFTMTASVTASIEVVISATDSLLATSTDSAIASVTSLTTQSTSTSTSTSTTSSTTSATSKQRVPVSSPKVSPAASNQPHTSTPLVQPATPTTSATTNTPVVNSSSTTAYYYPASASSSSQSTSSSAAYSTSTWDDYYSSSTQSASSTTDGFGGAVHTGISSGSGSSDGSGSSTNTGSSGSGSSISPTTSKIVGGVVGSVAGLALIFALLFYILRRRGYFQRFFKDKGGQALPSSDAGPTGSREIAERPSSMFTTAYLAPAFMKRWRNSTMTTRTDSTVDSCSSERGFQKISGRKIPPVLTHGGDGFGGRVEGHSPTIPDCLIGLSPPSSAGPSSSGAGALSSPTAYGPPPASPFGSPLDTNYTREIDEFPRPPRPKIQLPASSSVNFGSPTMVTSSHPIPQPQSAVPVLRPDALGRSHPSFDGSRSSRFTESLDL
ncbi:hypothetical protein N7466_010443 [Penicillium verhagenii]|uniref:uncharacterized protein n=1 Tax=Penicillium verhagenii TaxID=1562060 RepID=UPI0025458DA6|nr:uncharacterized protein N7466_010443 [Penicillium verhagenii]KAJ5918451.1 hypothetical protein N7466_010443 [Penicillium verhagenii]